MIFPDTITLSVRTAHEAPGGGMNYTWDDHPVAGVATFLDSSVVFDVASNITRSRLKIVLSPSAAEIIPPDASSADLAFKWAPFDNLAPDGAVEPHYLRGRLHHYEVIAKTV